MTAIALGGINHLTLTVSDARRSLDFYTKVLNFQMSIELSPKRFILSNGQLLLVITEPSNPNAAIPMNDRFEENRIGLDHISFNIESYGAMQEAAQELDRLGVTHGEIRDLSEGGIPIYVMAFRDPDNIQLEMTAPR